jgi:two-component system, LytTR family, response regulator
MKIEKRGLPFIIATTKCDEWLYTSDIIRLEAELKQTKIYTIRHSEPIIAKQSLSHFENLFVGEPHLFRCHRSHIINMEYIKSSSNGKRTISTPAGVVPLARNKKRIFMEQFCSNINC